MNPKILTLTKLVKIRKQDKTRKRKWVFTNGCFDLLHYGHVAYLRAAKKLGDKLVVGLNQDVSVRRLKGKTRPITPEKERAEILAALECIDYVVLFGEDTPLHLIEAISPDVLVKGSDWKHGQIVGESHVLASGGKVRRIRLEPGLSTTNIVEKIKRTLAREKASS